MRVNILIAVTVRFCVPDFYAAPRDPGWGGNFSAPHYPGAPVPLPTRGLPASPLCPGDCLPVNPSSLTSSESVFLQTPALSHFRSPPPRPPSPDPPRPLRHHLFGWH